MTRRALCYLSLLILCIPGLVVTTSAQGTAVPIYTTFSANPKHPADGPGTADDYLSTQCPHDFNPEKTSFPAPNRCPIAVLDRDFTTIEQCIDPVCLEDGGVKVRLDGPTPARRATYATGPSRPQRTAARRM